MPALAVPLPLSTTYRAGTVVNVGVCCRSLLSNLRVLSLESVAIHLPALRPIATRLQRLDITQSRLDGSADGFLSAGWTALTRLHLHGSQVVDDALTALSLPALKELSIICSHHKGLALQRDQLWCPQLCSLAFQLDIEGSEQRISLLRLALLVSQIIMVNCHQDAMDLGLPASLTSLTVHEFTPHAHLDRVLHEAVECIKGGAQLRSFMCAEHVPPPHPECVPWGASSDAHYRALGEQLSSLEVLDLTVTGSGLTLLSAFGAVACSAPSLTCLKRYASGPTGLVLPPICSASLKRSITALIKLPSRSAPLVLLTFLSGCAQLRDVLVQIFDTPTEGASVKIRCHCNSESCIVPFVGHIEPIDDELPWDLTPGQEEVGVRLLPTPASPQAVQPYTVLFTCHAAGPEQAPKWGHVVMPGVL